MKIALFVTATEQDVIGRDGNIPWHIAESARHFQALITGSVIIVGHRTFEEIVREVGRPLPGVLTIVLTQSPWPGLQVFNDRDIVLYQPTVQSALKLAKAFTWFIGKKELFIIGGAQIFAATLPYADRIYLTRIHTDISGDVRMPIGWLDDFELDRSAQATRSVAPHAELDYSLHEFNRKLH
jgi:dihydrofolate reductase